MVRRSNDDGRLLRLVSEHVEHGAVLYEPPAFEQGLVGELQVALHHLFACLPVGAPAQRRYLGLAVLPDGHRVRATFHFQWTTAPGHATLLVVEDAARDP